MDRTQLLAAIASEIQNDPVSIGYAPYFPGSPGKLHELLTRTKRQVVRTRMTSARGIADKYPGGPIAAEAVLQKLEQFSLSTNTAYGLTPAAVKRQLAFLNSEGLDFGSTTLRAMLDQFATIGIISSQEASNLKSIALQDGTRAEELGLGNISEADVREALGI